MSKLSHHTAYLKSRIRRSFTDLGLIPAFRVGTGNLANREIWLESALAAISPGSRILDAGAGELRYRHLCTHLTYVSQDFGQYDGTGDGSGLQTGQWDQTRLDIVSDIAAIPEPSGSFDAVMCIEVIEHIPHPVDALRELARLLRPGGELILTAPFCSITHLSPYFFQTGYSRYFYEYWLTEFGFEIEDMQWNGNYFEYLAQELRRLPSVSKRHAGRSLSPIEKVSVLLILKALERFSTHDQGSEKLLSFGLHVRARKRIDQPT